MDSEASIPQHTPKIETLEDLRIILASPDAFSIFSSLDAAQVPSAVELLQSDAQAQRSSTDNEDYRNLAMKCLRVLVKKHRMLPQSLFLDNVIRDGAHPLRGGGFADIWKGNAGEQPVCLKVLRMHLERDERRRDKAVADFCQEAVLWTQLNHPNVLPFLGVNTQLFAPGFCLVSPWMANGDIVSYLRENPEHDRLKSISEIASGLAYLHALTPMIIHGDIKGANILVDNQLKCCLADFGLAAITGETHLMNSTTSSAIKGSLRWMAPEMYTSMGAPTNAAGADKSPRDIYAYACTVFEIMTGQLPFPGIVDPAVIFQVLSGARPKRPTDDWCPDNIWDLVELCWADDGQQRPPAAQIEEYLRRLMACRDADDPVGSNAFFSGNTKSSNKVPDAVTPAASHLNTHMETTSASVPVNTPSHDHDPHSRSPTIIIGTGGPPAVLPIFTGRWPFSLSSPTSVRSLQHSLFQLHPWFDAESWRADFIVDFSSQYFNSVQVLTHARLRDGSLGLGQTRLPPLDVMRQPATIPGVMRMRIVCDLIPQWPIDISIDEVTPGPLVDSLVTADVPPITLLDVLICIHRSLHTRISHADWAKLTAEEESAVARAYTRRCKALRGPEPLGFVVGEAPSPSRGDEAEAAARADGVKRVDFLLDRVWFRGCVVGSEGSIELIVD